MSALLTNFAVKDAIISRSKKCFMSYNIHFPKATEHIGWNENRVVSYSDTLLFVYSYGTAYVANRFIKWAEQIERERQGTC